MFLYLFRHLRLVSDLMKSLFVFLLSLFEGTQCRFYTYLLHLEHYTYLLHSQHHLTQYFTQHHTYNTILYNHNNGNLLHVQHHFTRSYTLYTGFTVFNWGTLQVQQVQFLYVELFLSSATQQYTALLCIAV
jgi:hypothetical protein